MTRIATLLLLCVGLLLGSTVVGCGSSEPSLRDINDTNLKKLRAAYGLFLVQHAMRGPESEEELKEYLKSNAAAQVKLERMGVGPEQIDNMFINERDGQPFLVRYGLRGLGDYPIVFEAEGVDGKRYVAYAEPKEFDSAKADDLWKQNAKAAAGMPSGI